MGFGKESHLVVDSGAFSLAEAQNLGKSKKEYVQIYASAQFTPSARDETLLLHSDVHPVPRTPPTARPQLPLSNDHHLEPAPCLKEVTCRKVLMTVKDGLHHRIPMSHNLELARS
jgi:hypothetical protein